MKIYLKKSFLFVIFTLAVLSAFAQLFSNKPYPRGYFQYPVRSAVALSANFGELRPNHYHMGLDCKTEQRENLPILAAADGYVARVKIEPFGFGRAIYINHPNGLTTLYAHLNAFYPELEKYVTEQQYKLQQWQVMLDIPENLLPVNKGMFIANSGNTGGSQGPHLHFELRDTKTDKVLNPLLFGFPIPDNIPPDILRLAVYDRRISTYEQSPSIYPLKKVNGVYVPVSGTISLPYDKVSFAITAYDRYTGSTNQNGIFRAELFDNNDPVIGFEMDSISYTETRLLNAHIDYAFKSRGGSYLEHLSRLPGSESGIYKAAGNHDGVILLQDESPRNMSIKVSDADKNVSTLQFTIRRSGWKEPKQQPANSVLFKPGMINVFENERIRFYLPENALYDTCWFTYSSAKAPDGSMLHVVHQPSVPLHGYFTMRIKADFPLSDSSRIIMKRSHGTKKNFKKADYENGWYKASFRDFGNYELFVDSIPPVVTPIGFKDGMNASKLNRIVFQVTDNAEDIKSFRALLDGRWLRFSNDKGKNFVYAFDEYCIEGPHELKLIVEDLAGNKTEKTYRFTR